MGLARGIGPTLPGKVPAGGPAAAPPGGPFAKLPLLSGWLTETAWEDGEKRTPGSLLIFAQDGKWKAMITEKDQDNIAFVSGDDFNSLLGALEKGLRDGTLDWRIGRSTASQNKKGR